MELSKRKYKKSEVVALLESLTNEKDLTINTQKSTIGELSLEIDNLKKELLTYKDKEDAILRSLKSAEQKIALTKSACEKHYDLTVRTLEDFIMRFSAYFDTLKERYPLYPAVKQALEIKNELEKLLSKSSSSREIVEKTDKKLKKYSDKNQVFNPKKKINDYIVATSDTGFNIDEVLNPGELKLEELCKELGLTEEN